MGEHNTFREGLLTAMPATSSKTPLAFAPVDATGDCRPFSLFFPDPDSCPCRIGLEGRAGSLLGCGVKAGPTLVKAFFENDDAGVFFTGVAAGGAGLGEFVDFFWKKPRMDFWLLDD
jgi:hypothetical protein